mmetsp:Transcript_69273/g.103043  ORF Transcript_69273/g.103043 Transcript_69273/m.103043 type:complete len:84 (-) Transcript_69273:246-497(-)
MGLTSFSDGAVSRRCLRLAMDCFFVFGCMYVAVCCCVPKRCINQHTKKRSETKSTFTNYSSNDQKGVAILTESESRNYSGLQG